MRISTKTIIKKRDSLLPRRKRFCRFCRDKVKIIDYKELRTLEAFIKERAKIVSRRNSGNCAKHQKMITEAIKRARFISLLPYAQM
jgi:small subunit ribosomal protein S18